MTSHLLPSPGAELLLPKVDYLSLEISVYDQWISEYFKNEDIDKLSDDEIHKFLEFHLDQAFRRRQQELENVKDSYISEVAIETYRRDKEILTNKTINPKQYEMYRDEIKRIIKRYQPRDLGSLTGDLPIKLKPTDPDNFYWSYDLDFTNQDIGDFLLKKEAGWEEDIATPAESDWYFYVGGVIDNLTPVQYDKYRSYLIQVKTGDEITLEDFDEYFANYDETMVITHQIYCQFLAWIGYDPNELTTIKLAPEYVYGSYHEVRETLRELLSPVILSKVNL